MLSYVREPGSGAFLRVPPEYYIDDAFGVGRCAELSRFNNDYVPTHLANAPIFVIQSDVEAWAKRQVSVPVRRGPKPTYDAEAFIVAARAKLAEEGRGPHGDDGWSEFVMSAAPAANNGKDAP